MASLQKIENWTNESNNAFTEIIFICQPNRATSEEKIYNNNGIARNDN